MGTIRVVPDYAYDIAQLAVHYGQSKGARMDEIAIATVAAGVFLASHGMNDEQVRDILEQAFQFSVHIRKETAERWKKEGFDPYAEKES